MRLPDEAGYRIGEQVLRVALRRSLGIAPQDPTDVRVNQTAQRPTQPRAVLMRAVRVAGLVGEAMVLAVIGDPLDQGALDRSRSEGGEHEA